MADQTSRKKRQSLLTAKSLPIWSFVLVGLALVTGLRLMRSSGAPPKSHLVLAGPAKRPFAWLMQKSTETAQQIPESEQAPPWARAIAPELAQIREGKFVQQLAGGRKAILTLDPGLQHAAETLLRRYEIPYGGIVMMDAHTGRLLVMAGASAADRNLRTAQLCLTPWAPAASVFKVITTSALLSENRSRLFTRVCYHGGKRRLSARHLIDDPTKDDQCDTLAGALAKSTNAIIAKLARKHLDRATLLRYASAFGFNRPIGFVIPPKISPAAIPRDPVARAKVAAGFWHTNLSVLHAALIAQTIANRGVMVRPRILASVTKDGIPEELPPEWKRPVISEFVASLLTKAMVMTTTVGTARKAFYTRSGQAYVPWAKVAGKTGSLTRVDPYVAYSWFVGFAPADHPKVAFAVLLGNPKRWRVKAAHIARMLLQKYGKLHPEVRKQSKGPNPRTKSNATRKTGRRTRLSRRRGFRLRRHATQGT